MQRLVVKILNKMEAHEIDKAEKVSLALAALFLLPAFISLAVLFVNPNPNYMTISTTFYIVIGCVAATGVCALVGAAMAYIGLFRELKERTPPHG